MNVTELAQAIRGGLIQRDRLLKTDIPSLPSNALVPRRAVTRSELGRDFGVVLDLVSTASDIELKMLIAQPITLTDRELSVRGEKPQGEDDRTFLYKGIAARGFQRSFILAEGWEVDGARLLNGLLRIDLKRVKTAPDVRKIPITLG